jgi:hypothetical protein
MSEKTTDDVRITALEKAVDEIKEDIKAIKDNHLQHLQMSLSSMANDISWIKTAMYVFYSTIIIAAIGAVIKILI